MATRKLSVLAFLGLVGWVLPLIVIFLIAPKLYATAGAERFGILMVCFVVPLIAQQLDFGISTAAARRFAAELGNGQIGASSIVIFGVGQIAVGCLLGATVALLARPLSDYLDFTAVLGADEGTSLLRWCGLWSAVALGSALPTTIARAAQRLLWMVFVQTAMTVTLWVGALQATMSRLPIDTVVRLGTCLSAALGVLTWLIVHRHVKWRGRLRFSLQQAVPDLRFSLGSFVSQLAGVVIHQGDRVLVAALGSPAAAGAYTLCTNLANKLLAAVVALTSFVFPHASNLQQQQGPAGVEELLHAVDRSIVALVVPPLVIAFGLATPFLSLWLKEHASPDLSIAFRLLLIAYTAVALIVPVSIALAASGRTKVAARYAWLTAIVITLSMVLLVPRFGVVGAAVSVVTGQSTVFLFNRSARRVLGIGTQSGRRRFLLGVAAGAAMQAAVMVLLYRFADTWSGLVAVAAITWSAFYGTRVILRCLSPEERRFLLRLTGFVSERLRGPKMSGRPEAAGSEVRVSHTEAVRSDDQFQVSSLASPPGPRSRPQPELESPSTSDRIAADARIRAYEYQSLLSEVAHLEKLHAQQNATPSVRIRNLEGRPYAVRLIESAAAGRALGMVQSGATALLPIVKRLKRIAWHSQVVMGDGRLEPSGQPEFDESRHAAHILVRRPNILLDVTPTFRQPHAEGGIPRTTRSLARAAVETGLGLPVVTSEGELRSYYRHSALLKPIVPGPEDIYVVTDVFWYLLKEYSTIISSVRRRGTKVALVLYDILPLRYPSLYPEEVPRTFELGIREFLPQCDYCVSISKSTEDDVLEYVSASKLPTRDSIAFRHFHLGLDPESAPHGDMRAAVEAAFLSECTFLSVGTLEPRKGYAIALDACERAWTSGAEFKFVIIGRYGWRSQALRERILAHPEFGKRLFWFNDANDRELAYSYSRCRALIQSSVAEGFGLPILEAARFGAPVIASDLPVFREIGGSALSFFPIGNEQALADLITRFLALPRVSPKIPSNTWADSMRELTACLSMSERP